MANIIFSPPKDESELPQHSTLHTGKLMCATNLGCSIFDAPPEIRKKEPSILISNLNNTCQIWPITYNHPPIVHIGVL